MRRKKTTLLKVVALSAALGGAGWAHAQPQLRVGLSGECPSAHSGGVASPRIAPIVAGIAASLAAEAAKSLIDKLNDYLTTEKSVNVQDTYPAEALFISDGQQIVFAPEAQCVWVAVADEFHTPRRDSTGRVQTEVDGTAIKVASPEAVSTLVQFNAKNKAAVVDFTGADSPLLFYYEAEVRQPQSKTGWRLVPLTAYYPKFLHSSNIFQSRLHDLSLTIQYASPGSGPFATYHLVLPALSEGELTRQMVASKGTGWLAVPQATTAPTGGVAFYPVNVTAQLIETRKPNEVAMALGKVAKDKETDLSNQLSAKVLYSLSQDTRTDTYTAAATAAKSANDVYNKAYDDAKAAYDLYSTAKQSGDPGTINRTLNNARVAYKVLDLAKADAERKMAAANLAFQALPDLPSLA
ncbi:hypothetical protein [Cupriavidus numazuensis]|uniref:Uncharacterized protein n=1 Tax=Cupriavidus numazuensis TaxID=221992 RepID=A0ABN7QHE3_9BURK|nr:hypothetical protein [Cupriavidus numazuensis]CAG2161231.1 hypothetical protein LMG26411_08086 [Cupriavidus numazuensis]